LKSHTLLGDFDHFFKFCFACFSQFLPASVYPCTKGPQGERTTSAESTYAGSALPENVHETTIWIQKLKEKIVCPPGIKRDFLENPPKFQDV
jgi:hypothetical protein